MRKMSQDGGDNTSITSGIDNEIKKSGPGILKSTKNSIKRKVQNFSTESDDTANEPLLHKSKEKSEIEKQSAKFLLSKTKTDFASVKDNDKDKLLADDTIAMHSITDITEITEAATGSGLKDLKQDISQSLSSGSVHNHTITNVFNTFNSSGGLKNTVVTKSQILVAVDTSKPSGYAPSPLIFTTAKIHIDGKMQEMEPVQVTPVPISTTIEGGIVKTGIKIKQSVKNKETALKSTHVTDVANVPEKYHSHVTNENIANGSMKRFEITNNDSKVKVCTPLCSTTQTPITSKITSVESTRIKNSTSYSISNSTKTDFTTATLSSTKLISPSSFSSIAAKSTPTAKQLTSPSTVKTISSVPTVKSAAVGTIHHDKMSTKGVSIPVKPTSTISYNTTLASTTSKKPLVAKGPSMVTVTPSAKVVATTSTKPAAVKSSAPSDVKSSEDKKDSKGSKA